MPFSANRENVAYHAAAKTLVLMEAFNQNAEWKGATPEVYIHPFNAGQGTYSAGSSVRLAAPSKVDYWKEKFKERDAIVRDVALSVAGDAGEDFAKGISDQDRGAALEMAQMITGGMVGSSLAFINGASESEIAAMAQESFDYAARVVKTHKAEFENLVQVFRQCDKLTGTDQITAAARTGQKPPSP